MAWGSKLARPIALTSGEKLITLRDAATYLQDHFQRSRDAVLHGAIEDLMRAADTGAVDDRRDATDQVEIFLRAQQRLTASGKLIAKAKAGPPDIQVRLREAIEKARRLA